MGDFLFVLPHPDFELFALALLFPKFKALVDVIPLQHDVAILFLQLLHFPLQRRTVLIKFLDLTFQLPDPLFVVEFLAGELVGESLDFFFVDDVLCRVGFALAVVEGVEFGGGRIPAFVFLISLPVFFHPL